MHTITHSSACRREKINWHNGARLFISWRPFPERQYTQTYQLFSLSSWETGTRHKAATCTLSSRTGWPLLEKFKTMFLRSWSFTSAERYITHISWTSDDIRSYRSSRQYVNRLLHLRIRAFDIWQFLSSASDPRSFSSSRRKPRKKTKSCTKFQYSNIIFSINRKCTRRRVEQRWCKSQV